MQNIQIRPQQVTRINTVPQQQQQQNQLNMQRPVQQPNQILPQMMQVQQNQQQQMHANKGNMMHMHNQVQHQGQMQMLGANGEPISMGQMGGNKTVPIMMKGGPQGQMQNSMGPGQFRANQVQMGQIQMQNMNQMNMNMPMQSQMNAGPGGMNNMQQNMQQQGNMNSMNVASSMQNMPMQNIGGINVLANNQNMPMQSIGSNVQNIQNTNISSMNVPSSMGHNTINIGPTSSVVTNILNTPRPQTVVKMLTPQGQPVNMQPQVRPQFINQQATQQMLNNQNSGQLMGQGGAGGEMRIISQGGQQQIVGQMQLNQRNSQQILSQQQSQQNVQQNNQNGQILNQSNVGQILNQGNQQQAPQTVQMMNQHGSMQTMQMNQQNSQQMMNQNVQQLLNQSGNQQSQQNVPQLINQPGSQQMMNQPNSLPMQLQNSQGNAQQQQQMMNVQQQQQQQQQQQNQQNQQVPGLINQLQSSQPMIGQQKMNPIFAQNQNQQQSQNQQILNSQRVNQIMNQQQQQQQQQQANSNQQVINQIGGQQMLVQQNGSPAQMQTSQQQMQAGVQQGQPIQGTPMFQQSQMRMVNANPRLLMQPQIRMQANNNQINMQPNQQIRARQMMPNQSGPIVLQNQPPTSLVFQQGTQIENMTPQQGPRMNLVRPNVPPGMQQSQNQVQPTSQAPNQTQGTFQTSFQHSNMPTGPGGMNNANNMMQLNNNISHSQTGPNVGPGGPQIGNLVQKNGPQPNTTTVDSGSNNQVLSNNSSGPGQQPNGNLLNTANGMNNMPNNMNMPSQVHNQAQPSLMQNQSIGANKNMFSPMRMVLNNSIPQPSPTQSQVSPQQSMIQSRLQVPQQNQIINSNQHVNSPQSFAVPSPMTPAMLGSPGQRQMNHIPASPSGPINTPASPSTTAPGHADPPSIGSYGPPSNISQPMGTDPNDDAAYYEKLKSLTKYTGMISFIMKQWEKDPRKSKELGRIKHMYSTITDCVRIPMEILEGYEKFLVRYERSRIKNKSTLPAYSVAEMSPSQMPALAPRPVSAVNSIPPAVPNQPHHNVTPLKQVTPQPIAAPLTPDSKFGEWHSTVDLLQKCVTTPGLSAVTGRILGPALSVANRDPPSPKSDYVLFNGLSVVQRNTLSTCKNDALPALKKMRFDSEATKDEFCKMLQRELAQLRHEDFEFEPLHPSDEGGKSHHLVCRLKNPIVPQITVYISDRYPEVAPYHEFNSRAYQVTKELRQIYQHFENLVLDHSDTFTFTGLMYDWRKAVNMFTPSRPMIRVGYLQPVKPEEV